MASHPLLDIQDALVSSANPPLHDGTLDVERCVKLHNYLVALSWMERTGKGPQDLDELMTPSRHSYFRLYGPDADRVRSRLDQHVTRFLESIIMPAVDEEKNNFFLWVQGVGHPNEIHNEAIDEIFGVTVDEGGDNLPPFVLLYPMTIGLQSHSLGVVYHQASCRVTFVASIFFTDLVDPVHEHEDKWFALEHLLSHWIGLVHKGKVTIGPERWPMGSVQGVWRMEPYSEAQVADTVKAFDNLVGTIEERMQPLVALDMQDRKPLLTDENLDAAGAPQKCFARSFLTRVAAPRFRFIAPGLEVPHNAAAFASRQQFTYPRDQGESEHDELIIPPILMFASAGQQIINLDDTANPFPSQIKLPHSSGSSVLTGLYSESIELAYVDNAEEGFRLLLPFSLQGGEHGAKMSDGLAVGQGSIADLFQHGNFPLGGLVRSQRLERLFTAWTNLIKRQVWTVGDEGVEGSINIFKDADNGDWENYWIPMDIEV